MAGYAPFASTKLTLDPGVAGTTITVASTNGFPASGILTIGSERVAYSNKSTTTFTGTILIKPLIRGTGGTTATAHAIGSSVRLVESAMINNSIDYDLALLADAAGLQLFLTVPVVIFSILLSFGVAPLAFLGTDLQILSILWAICFLGMIVSFFIAMAGGRRV